ncbi:MAG: LysR family transcriptional regulator [Litoreibacter sp.]
MKPKFVEIIVTIADCGSIGAAATQLGKSQPAITNALRKAEDELGERVFHRVPHGIIPTDLGVVVIERCRRISREMQQMDEELAQLKGDFTGTINIVAATIAAVQILPKVLKQFRRQHPKIRVNVSSGKMSVAYQSLLAGDIDFVVGPAPSQTRGGGLRSVPILESQIVVVTGANSRFIGVSDPAELKQGNWLVNGPVEHRPRYYSFFEAHGETPPDPAISADSIVAILSMVEDSDNLCCVPRELLEYLKGSREFASLPLGDQIGTATIFLTSAIDRSFTPAAILFADILQQHSEVKNETHN